MNMLFTIIGAAVLVVAAACLYGACCIKYMAEQEDKQLQEQIMEERLLGIYKEGDL